MLTKSAQVSGYNRFLTFKLNGLRCQPKEIMETCLWQWKECEQLNLNPALFFLKIRSHVLSLSSPQASGWLLHVFWLVGCWTSFSRCWTMSKINISPENPYGEVTIPRAKIRSPDDNATVIVNPMTMSSNEGNPPPYVVKEAVEEEGEVQSRTCCYRCRRKKWWEWLRSAQKYLFSSLFRPFSERKLKTRKWRMGTKDQWRKKLEEFA